MIVANPKHYRRFCVAGVAAATRDAMALSAPSGAGRTLSVRLCAQCHAVGKVGTSPHIGAPLFRHLKSLISTISTACGRGYEQPPRHAAFRFTREDASAMVAHLRSIQP